MHAHYPNQTLAGMAPTPQEETPHEPGHLVYQGTTVLAILLIIFSFWY
jgi:hypothetical protein